MNILIATDGSEFSGAALEFVLRFPFPRESNMTVLSVVDDVPMMSAELDALDEAQSKALHDANSTLRDDADKLLNIEGNRLREDGWPGTTLVRSGEPADEILRVAEEIEADLIVLGSHGTSGVKRFLLGSVSDRVLTYAACSVVIVKQSTGGEVPAAVQPGSNAAFRVMLAYDNSDAAHKALNLCASLPLEEGSEIRVVSVLPLITAYRQDIRQHLSNIWLQKKHIAQAALEQAVRSLQWATPNVSTELRESAHVADEILVAAEEAESDLIVVGCKEKSVIKRFLLGSITHRMARYADCSVWAVRNREGSV